MRKVFVLLFALTLGLGLVSCDQKAAGKAAAEQTEKVKSIDEIMENVRAEGANWSVEEWKTAFKDMMRNLKPMIVYLSDLQKRAEDNPDSILQYATEAQEKIAAMGDLDTVLSEFDSLATATENGRKVLDDKEFEAQVRKELDLPEE